MRKRGLRGLPGQRRRQGRRGSLPPGPRKPRGREEPRGAGRGRAGGALGARRDNACLPLVRKAGPGTRGGGGRSSRRLRGAVAVPLPAAAAPPPVPGSGRGGGAGAGGARRGSSGCYG